MKLYSLLLASLASATPHSSDRSDVAPNTAPSGGYAPSNSTCPPVLVRTINSSNPLSPDETAFVTGRRNNAVAAWQSYLTNSALNLTGFNTSAFLQNTSNLPNVAIAVSGGGYRAMLHAAGLFNAFDSRNDTALKQGTGGIVQLATYLAGLSGGSWFVGSIAVNNFPTIPQLHSFWNLESNVVSQPGLLKVLPYYRSLEQEVSQKGDAGFDLSLTDFWGRGLSRHLVNNSDNGLGTTYSSVRNLSAYTGYGMPFPIIIADGRAPGEVCYFLDLHQIIIGTNATIYEFNPVEFGSWDPSLRSFIPMEFLGTAAHAGVPNVTNVCVRGFDNAGACHLGIDFIMGTSATLFNTAIATLINSNSSLASALGSLVKGVLGGSSEGLGRWDLPQTEAPYPNTFNGINPQSFLPSGEGELALVDGGTDNENVPLWPVIQPERKVDVILALDASADTTFFWPNGSSLVETQDRISKDPFKSVPFPTVPSDTNTFVNRGLNNRTTFFGCNQTGVPLVIYVPNHPYTAYTNFSTFQLSYEDIEINAFLNNAMREAAGNGTTLPTCLACALTSRALQRAGTAQSDQCKACFAQYCWDGVSNSTAPNGEFEPSIPDVPASSQPGGAGTPDHPTPIKQKGNFATKMAPAAGLREVAVLVACVVSASVVLGGSLVLL
ncbi:hypothetical protein BS47DRAFT_1359473 [Hydnum rufescens UP504]|uniref:Lysophospholipase n=1 Tax=Hydnum rufescens UP504 TaxID=1448309 RepID=A0A9P6B697_9AGAM|nr:hypothetical protein BS47DRAFT_1359473 [Hydnum rufescens UP504]